MTKPQSSPTFDFDAWAALARQDPGTFEERRRLLIENAIRNAPGHRQQRLRCLQWKIDQIRHTSRTPMAACLRINRLLWERVTGENGLLARLQQPQQTDTRTRRMRHTAKVLPFRADLP